MKRYNFTRRLNLLLVPIIVMFLPVGVLQYFGIGPEAFWLFAVGATYGLRQLVLDVRQPIDDPKQTKTRT